MTRPFSIMKVGLFRFLRFGPPGFIVRSYLFALNASKALNGGKFDAVYTRSEAVASLLARPDRPVFYEMHDVRKGYLQKKSLRKAAGIIAITHGLADYCRSMGIDQEKILVAPDGVDLGKFEISEDQHSCRVKTGLPVDKKIVLYVGHLYEWKGAHVLAEAVSLLGKDVLVVFVGGMKGNVDSFRERFAPGAKGSAITDGRIFITGHQPHALIPRYLRAADVLVLPNSAKEDISRLYTSPMKLFEYMASGVPIVASNLPSIHEVIDESTAFFAKPDDPQSLAEGIRYVLGHQKEAVQKAGRSVDKVKDYDWACRGRRISAFIHAKTL
jgi:glycosyltransferase involved in cell wall biosynthesis